jgi:hypothetical protein
VTNRTEDRNVAEKDKAMELALKAATVGGVAMWQVIVRTVSSKAVSTAVKKAEDASPKSSRTRWHRRFANNLLKIWPALWTFTIIDGVQPTNNPAERALRGPMIHRKLSLGTQSESGERFAERALSAAATCRMQHRSLFTYLSELLAAHIRGNPFPALT